MHLLAPLNPPLPPWPEARVWIIGASYGIGAAVAQQLLAAGARIALSARSTNELRSVAGEAAIASGAARIEPLDVTKPHQIAEAWQRVRGAWDGIDLVLVVAGTHREFRAWNLDASQARALLEVNLHGPIAVAAAVVPGLLEQGRGAIGLVSSLAGYRGLPKALVYGPSKAALINFAETLYLDLRPKGIGVHLINPGFVKTPLTDRNAFRMPYLIGADEAASEILRGLRARAFEIHFPRAFSRWMKLLRLLPYRLYFPLVQRFTGT